LKQDDRYCIATFDSEPNPPGPKPDTAPDVELGSGLGVAPGAASAPPGVTGAVIVGCDGCAGRESAGAAGACGGIGFAVLFAGLADVRAGASDAATGALDDARDLDPDAARCFFADFAGARSSGMAAGSTKRAPPIRICLGYIRVFQ
jgi:hypothetical protein